MKPLLRTVAIVIVVFASSRVFCQDTTATGAKTRTWLILQAIPSLNWTVFPSQTNFALEWRATPVLYSFGMTELDPPWHFFFVNPPERFTGSIELNISGQVYPSTIGTTHLAWSGQLLGHVPLMEMGEYLGLNLGVASYRLNDRFSTFGVAGLSTFFGFIHWNTKYSPKDKIWMTSLEFRFF